MYVSSQIIKEKKFIEKHFLEFRQIILKMYIFNCTSTFLILRSVKLFIEKLQKNFWNMHSHYQKSSYFFLTCSIENDLDHTEYKINIKTQY